MSTKQMQEPTFLILASLAAGPRHGYGIMTDVTQISEGRVRLRAGTLYAALDRLSTDGLLEIDREEVVDNRLRRYYRLTAEGRTRLALTRSALAGPGVSPRGQRDRAASASRLRRKPEGLSCA
jgi:DNA-binding PadR family transcriptional regulator